MLQLIKSLRGIKMSGKDIEKMIDSLVRIKSVDYEMFKILKHHLEQIEKRE